MTTAMLHPDRIGERLRTLRKHRAISLRELARSIGCSPSALSSVENGRNRPSLLLLQLAARRLGFGVKDLLSDSAFEPPPATEPVPFTQMTLTPGAMATAPVHIGRVGVLVMLDGAFTVTVAESRITVSPGRSLRYSGGTGVVMHNFGRNPASALLGYVPSD